MMERASSAVIAKNCRQLLAGLSSSGGELCITRTDVRLSAHAMVNPLAHIAAKMQHKVADGVFMRAAARPDLLGRDALQTRSDGSGGLGQLAVGIAEEVCCEVAGHSNMVAHNATTSTGRSTTSW